VGATAGGVSLPGRTGYDLEPSRSVARVDPPEHPVASVAGGYILPELAQTLTPPMPPTWMG
jgi:hypothetical protein